MKIGFLAEHHDKERRAPIVPAHVEKLCGLGADVVVERGLGAGSDIDDSEYESAGAALIGKPEASEADVGTRVPREVVGDHRTVGGIDQTARQHRYD